MVNHVMFEMNVSRNSRVLKHDDLQELHRRGHFQFHHQPNHFDG